VRNIFKFDAVNSTNDLLMKWAENVSTPNGSVIWALNQYKGRGQHGRVWESTPRENLMFSMLIRHETMTVMDQFIFNKAISVALLKSLKVISSKFEIKWPNDIYINGKKIAGILIENSIKGKYLDYSVVGIGVNVKQRKFPKAFNNASSLINETDIDVEIENLLFQIIDHIEFFVNYIHRNEREKILDIYLENLFRKDEISVFRKGKKKFNGIIRGVDDYGRIRIELENEEIVLFNNGEIKMMV
jgi:BirA family biotin operon repressor/biotin-[acetyl-CoA-carboxylase] ligase